MFINGKLSSPGFQKLSESVNMALDTNSQNINDLKTLLQLFDSQKLYWIMNRLSKLPFIGSYARQKLFSTYEKIYDALINYIEAHHLACENLSNIVNEDEMLGKIKEESEGLCK